MKVPIAFVACVCLLGSTQFAFSQGSAATTTAGKTASSTARGVPGYYDPATGQFTTRVTSDATPQIDTQAALAGTSIFFREDFQIKIWNYDQSSSAQVTCTAEIETADANGIFSDSYSVPAVASGGNWTCDVPILTLWTLQNPGADEVSAIVSVQINGATAAVGPIRESTQSLTLSVPSNTQTVVNTVVFQL